MLACARIGAIHSVVFGGFAARELATRIDDAQAEGRSCPPPAGSKGRGSCPTSRSSTRRIALAAAKPEACLDPPAAAGRGRARRRARPRLGRGRRRGAGRRARQAACVPVLATDPLYVLYTSGHDRQAEGRRARQRRPHGRAEMVDEEPSTASNPARCSGPPPTSAGWSAIPTSSTRRSCTAAPRSSTRASRSARPMRARSGGSSRSTASSTLFTAPTAFRAIKKEDPSAELLAALRPVALPRPLPRRRAGRSRHGAMGREASSATPVIDHWWQTETGWPIAGNPARARPAAGQARLADRADAGLRRRRCSTRAASPVAAEHDGLDRRRGCRCRPAACRPCGTPTSASARATSRPSRATTTPRMRASSTRTATSGSWAARTTSSTSPGTGSRPAAWRRCWRPIRPSPNAPSSASGTRSRARCRAASWC